MEKYQNKIASTLLLITFLLPQPVHAQDMRKITGTVLKLHDKEPFAGVRIEGAGSKAYELTDKIGAFELMIPNTVDSVIISSKGYKSQIIPVKNIGSIGTVLLERQWITSGYITDESGVRLPGVNVYTQKNNDKNFHFVTTTDTSGFYELYTTSDISHLTFSTENYFPGDTVFVSPFYNYYYDDIKLREVQLKKLPVPFFDYSISTGLKSNQKISETPASVVVITRKEISEYGFQTLDEILEYVTGLYLLDDYNWTGGGPVIGVRGFFSEGFNNNIVILVNGVNQYEDYWGNYALSKIPVPVEAIDKIEIIRGPASETYGTGAFFGAVNIITNQKKENNEGIVSLSQGSNDSRRVAASFNIPTRKLDVHFAASLAQAHGLNKPFSDFSSRYTGTATTKDLLENQNNYIILSADYRITENARIGIELSSVESKREIFESTTSSTSSCQCPIPESHPEADGSVAGITSYYSQISYSQKLHNNFLLQGKFGFFSFKSSTDYTKGGNRYGFSTYESQAIGGELVGFAKLFKNLNAAMGISVRRSANLISTFDIPDGNLLNGNSFRRLSDNHPFILGSLYMQGEYKTGKVTLIAGLRVEDTNNFVIEANDPAASSNLVTAPIETEINKGITSLIPRAALLYSLDNNSVLKLLYGQATKRPSFGNYTDASDLKPATIRTFEINYIRELASGLLINSSIYHNLLDNLINRFSSVDANGNSVYASDNAGKVRTTGIELGLRATTRNRRLQADVSTSLGTSRDNTTYAGFTGNITEAIDPDAQLSYSPSWLAYGKITYAITPYITGSLLGRYLDDIHAGIYTPGLFESNQVQRIGETIPGYAVLNANIHVQKLSALTGKNKRNAFLNHIFVNFRISNLTNADVRYPTTGNNQAWADKGSPGFGRRFFITIGYRFSDAKTN